ncbi:MAG: metal-dependent hydrolase [Candidatus Dormibacteraeota bacterium]|nr:metal-dependent hydrolase [Candidatus Dormibacteraeota bacterium]
MALNDKVSFTWLGHGTWQVATAGGRTLLLDAWVMNNPVTPEQLKNPERVDIIAITHGHFDHIHDAVDLARKHSSKVLAIPETAGWLKKQGIENTVDFNKGGTVEVDGIRFTMTHAEHSCGITDGDQVIYGGEAVGYVIEFENGFKIYFAGDTDVFGDMALIREIHEPEVAFLPIGDWYTMSPRKAAKAAELLGVSTVVPMHFGTFPILTGKPSDLQAQVGGGVKVLDIKPGDRV